MNFPIFKTKIEGESKKFDLTDPVQVRKYFEFKADKEIEKLKDFVREHTFIAYFLGKKFSGKGTYSKMFIDIVDPQKIEHFSVGDTVREIEEKMKDEKKFEEIFSFLKKHYRGFVPLEEALEALKNRSTKTLLPTELILAFIKMEIDKRGKKSFFIDGFPRDLDQISFSLFFRDLIGYRYDPDIFLLIDVPNSVIEERIKWRRVCPKCQTPRNLKLLPTKEVGFDGQEFYLICDTCKVRMVKKEGDELGIEPIKERLEKEGKMMETALALHGIEKILLRNAIPVKIAKDYVDDYEITPEFHFEIEGKKVKTYQKPWILKDDEGEDSYSLLAPPVVLSLIKQLVKVLGL